MKNIKYIYLSLFIIVSLSFNACGIEGNNSIKRADPIVTGVFVDSRVENLMYVCSSGATGKTDSVGAFTCKKGDDVTFKIGDYILGTTAITPYVTPFSLYKASTDLDKVYNVSQLLHSTDLDKVYNISQLLHSFDIDRNPDNNIVIDDNLVNFVPLTNVKIASDAKAFQNSLSTSFASVGKTLYNRNQAKAKMLDYFNTHSEVDVSISKVNSEVNVSVSKLNIEYELARLETLMCISDYKLVNGLCVTRTCRDDAYGCPICPIDERLIYNVDGSGSCIAKTCLTGQKLQGGLCIAQTCQDDGYLCPTCKTNEDLTFLSNGDGLCVVKTFADAGIDQAVYISETAILSAEKSTTNSTIISYEWKEGDKVLSNSISFEKSDFAVGNHYITLTIKDARGTISTDNIKVQIFDSFSNLILPIEIIRSTSDVIGETGSVTVTGKQFKITNNTNRELKLTRFEVLFGDYIAYSTTDQYALDGDGRLAYGESVTLGEGVPAPLVAGTRWIGKYYITDIKTNKYFTNQTE